jgi:LPS-assembly protein
MSGPVHTTSTTTPHWTHGLRLIVTALITAGARVARADECADPAQITEQQDIEPAEFSPDQPIEFEADGVEGTRDGAMLLRGNVVIRHGPRQLKTQDAEYDPVTQRFNVKGGVEYAEPTLRVSGESAHIDPAGAAQFEEAQFALPAVNARGGARRIRATSQGEIELDGVHYTTCPLGNEDWMLRAEDIDISQKQGLGIGRGVRLDFKGFPLLYAPFITFPVGDARKSGFLYPTIGSSSSSGYSLAAPWYWNIAPNYDATLVPTWYF